MQDATIRLAELCAPRSVAAIRVLYPDPWPKKRHHKRRLLDADFLLLARKLLIDRFEMRAEKDGRTSFDLRLRA